MGMFDSVYVTCPSCGDTVEFQSKAGECSLKSYSITSVPAEIASSLDGYSRQCRCGEHLTLLAPAIPCRVEMIVKTKEEDWD
jgi:hypothetical protein